MEVAAPVTDPLHVMCAVCSGHAGGHGYALDHRRPAVWACDDPACITLLPKVYAMSKEQIDGYEKKAIDEGGFLAGSYLESIKKFGLDTLSSEEWGEFCRRMFVGYRASMRRQIEGGEAPF